MTANTPSSRKAKGRKFQQQIRQDLIDALHINPLDIQSTGMGQAGCDLYLSAQARAVFPFGIEAKAQETVSLWSWWKQAGDNARKENLIPLLVFKKNRTQPLVVLDWDVFLSLISRQVQP